MSRWLNVLWLALSGLLSAEVAAQDMIDMIASFEGIDEAGAVGLIGSIYGYEPGEDFPPMLPFVFQFEFLPVEAR